VQPKVRVFAWRVATDCLPTRKNKLRRSLEFDDRCFVCGKEPEDAYHATVRCTKAMALRHAMRKCWNLPGENCFRYTGSGRDWLQVLLGSAEESERAKILLLLWRAWHLRNDSIHNEGRESIERYASFLQAYDGADLQSLTGLESHKGKAPMFESKTSTQHEANERRRWAAPPRGWIKLNTYAAFSG
jgi:hypothetical protein